MNQTVVFDVLFTQAILWQQADRGFARARGDDLLGIVDIVDLRRIVAQLEKRPDAADASVLFFFRSARASCTTSGEPVHPR